MRKQATSSLSSISSWWNGLSDDVKRDIIVTAAGTATGASVGAAVDGWRGAAVGAPVVGATSYVGSHYAVPMVISLLNARKTKKADQAVETGVGEAVNPGLGTSSAKNVNGKNLNNTAKGVVVGQAIADQLKPWWML